MYYRDHSKHGTIGNVDKQLQLTVACLTKIDVCITSTAAALSACSSERDATQPSQANHQIKQKLHSALVYTHASTTLIMCTSCNAMLSDSNTQCGHYYQQVLCACVQLSNRACIISTVTALYVG
jgi:hypothetical protein